LSIPSVISRHRQHVDSDVLDRSRWSGRYGPSPISGGSGRLVKSGNSRRSSRSETSGGFRKSWNSNRAEGSVGSGKLVWSYWSTSANFRESGVSAAFRGVGSPRRAGRSGSRSIDAIKRESCDRPGHCDLHQDGATPVLHWVPPPSLSPTLVRVRGFPPSKFIPRPFQPDVSRDPTTFVASSADSHGALSDLLQNVKMVFDTLETCLDELDAWRLYLASGQ